MDSNSVIDMLSSGVIEVEYWKSPNNFMYQHNFKLACGAFFQMGEGQVRDDWNCRLEWNPNNTDNYWTGIILKIVSRLKYPKVTRLDWAVDYFDRDMTDYIVNDLVGRSEIEYRSRSKKRETLYIGSVKSDKFIRMYDKAKESKKKKYEGENWWRVEAVVKDFTSDATIEMESLIETEKGHMSKLYKEVKCPDGYLFKNPFDVIEIYEKDEKEIEMKIQDKAMLFFLKYNPDEWNNLSRNTRKKFEQLNYEANHFPMSEQPKEVFEKNKNRLAEEVESWLMPAMKNGKFLSGEISNIEYSMMYLREQENIKMD